MHTAIPYRDSKGAEQGFPCVVFPYRENPVFNTGFPGDGNRFFPVGNTTQGNPCFHYRDGFVVFQCIHFIANDNICQKRAFTLKIILFCFQFLLILHKLQ